MNKLQVKINEVQRRFYTPKNKKAYELENHLIKNGINEIGSYEIGFNNRKIDSSKNVEGWEERYAGLSMDHDERAIRTLFIKKLRIEDIDNIHEFEKKHCNRFLTIKEMKEKFKIREFLNGKWSEDYREAVINWMKEHKTYPEYKIFQGFKVPPYFIYDLEFDGMIYHHAIDKCVYYCQDSIIYAPKMDKNKKQLQEVFA